MVMKISCLKSETIHTDRMIMFGSSMMCGYDLNGNIFQRKMCDVVAIDIVEKENTAKQIAVTNFHTLPTKTHE